jgi:WD40 repeat protein
MNAPTAWRPIRPQPRKHFPAAARPTWKERPLIDGHEVAVGSVAFSPGGKLFATGSVTSECDGIVGELKLG